LKQLRTTSQRSMWVIFQRNRHCWLINFLLSGCEVTFQSYSSENRGLRLERVQRDRNDLHGSCDVWMGIICAVMAQQMPPDLGRWRTRTDDLSEVSVDHSWCKVSVILITVFDFPSSFQCLVFIRFVRRSTESSIMWTSRYL
jgi:hypothetical protein